MREPTTFERSGYINASPSGSGLWYPLFKTAGVNVSFVQEVGRDGEITSFLPFYDHDQFSFIAAADVAVRRLGDLSLYAFLDAQKRLVELDFVEIGQAVRTSDAVVADDQLPLLTQLSLARVGKASQSNQLRLLDSFLKQTVGGQVSRKIARAAHQRTASGREIWWDRYLAEDEDGRPALQNEFLDKSVEDLFSWLYENQVTPRWSLAFKTLMRRVVYDQRIFDLLLKLLTSSEGSFADASVREQSIIGRGLELYSALDSSENDFAEAVYEHVIDGDIFALTKCVSHEIIINFIDDLDSNGKIDVSPIDIYIDQLRSEYIESDLAYALIERVVSSDNLRTYYPEKSYYKNRTRLSVLKELVKLSGRLGLVLDAPTRRRVLRLADY